ncbi:uncharacterized protein [Triticum aestivum]|uniref:uncharacterized protein n=1 Tax=Triticum aestivum TaxID=4565 RepID=UPI001D035916|nr:uncharacterized protein LOC123113131 [Triticum aestivum]XP_044390217.1 uncharacterized protein LOC123113131 [Triticum aestivum]
MPVYAHMMYLKISVLTMTIGRATAKACWCEFLRMGIATVAATTHQQRRCSSMVPCLHLATSLLYLAMAASPTSNSGIQDLAGLGQPALRVQDPALMSLDSPATCLAYSS